MVVNIKLEYLRYKLTNVFNPQSDEIDKEEELVMSVLKITDQYDSLMKQAFHINRMETDILAIEMTFEQQPQIVLQGAFFLLMQDFKRLEILSDSSLGIDLWDFLVITWMIQILGMIANYQRCIHRKRYPIGPGIVGKVIQAAAIGCLIIPNMLLASATLLNAIYLHPLIYLCNLALTVFLMRCLFRKETGIDTILISAAPAHRYISDKLEDRLLDSMEDTTKNHVRRMDARFAPLLIQAVTLMVYLFTGSILRQTVFLYNLKASQGTFLNNITSHAEIFPTNWDMIVAIYAGFTMTYYLLTSLYYYIGHPWSMELKNK